MFPSTRIFIVAGILAVLLLLVLPVDVGVPAVAFGIAIGCAVWIVSSVASYRRRRRESYTVDGDPEIERLQAEAARVRLNDESVDAVFDLIFNVRRKAMEFGSGALKDSSLEERLDRGPGFILYRGALHSLADAVNEEVARVDAYWAAGDAARSE
jgi:hypothetical protein